MIAHRSSRNAVRVEDGGGGEHDPASATDGADLNNRAQQGASPVFAFQPDAPCRRLLHMPSTDPPRRCTPPLEDEFAGEDHVDAAGSSYLAQTRLSMTKAGVLGGIEFHLSELLVE